MELNTVAPSGGRAVSGPACNRAWIPPVDAANESTVNRSPTAGSFALDGDDATTKVDRCVVEPPRGMVTATTMATPRKTTSATAPTAHGRLALVVGSIGSLSGTD